MSNTRHSSYKNIFFTEHLKFTPIQQLLCTMRSSNYEIIDRLSSTLSSQDDPAQCSWQFLKIIITIIINE